MDGLAAVMAAACILFLAIGIPVVIARWVLRINEIVALLKRLVAGIEYIVEADKKP